MEYAMFLKWFSIGPVYRADRDELHRAHFWTNSST